jgi:choline-sulfatase
MTDQQRADAMGCSGGWVKTPALDRIAAQGLRFETCVTNSPVCIPARVSLATGLYPHNTGIWDNCPYDMPPDTTTWMQSLRNAGYRTSLFGKTHLHRHQGDLREREGLMHAYGLDDVDEIGGPRASARVLSNMTERWQQLGLWDAYREDYRERFSNKPTVVRPSALPLEEYADVYVGQQAVRYLDAYDRDEPWFCWVSFGGPHEPWDTPEPYAGLVDPDAVPAPVPLPEEGADRPRGMLDARLRQRPTCSEQEFREMRANYAGNVMLIDEQIGALLATIEKRGELGNTIIAFTSDHGEMNGDYGLVYKNNFLNGAVRIPLLIRTPETASSERAGAVCREPVELFDVGPTLVELAGGTPHERQFARSLCPVLRDPETTHRPFAVSELDGEIMIRDRRWKMALNAAAEPYLLFDLDTDPDEQQNLVTDSATARVQTELRLNILDHLVRTQIQKNRA